MEYEEEYGRRRRMKVSRMGRDVAEKTKLGARNFNYQTSPALVLEGESVLAQISDPSKIAGTVHKGSAPPCRRNKQR